MRRQFGRALVLGGAVLVKAAYQRPSRVETWSGPGIWGIIPPSAGCSTARRFVHTVSRHAGKKPGEEEPITIEVLDAEESHSGAGKDTADDTRHDEHQHYEDISSVDTYSRGRVFNFLGSIATGESSTAMVPGSGRGSTGSAPQQKKQTNSVVPKFETTVQKVHGRSVFHCRLRLSLPAPHGVRIALGIAENQKDSEVLATMHAERIIDGCGLKLYRLPRMQEKYATQVRQQGRWAPMPDDTEKDPLHSDVTVPLGLRMLSADLLAAHLEDSHPGERAAKAGHQVHAQSAGPTPVSTTTANLFDPTEGNRFELVNVNSFRYSPSDHTVQFPYIFDKRCLNRVKDWFAHWGVSFDSALKVSHVGDAASAKRMYVVDIVLTPLLLTAPTDDEGSLPPALRAFLDFQRRITGEETLRHRNDPLSMQKQLFGRGKSPDRAYATMLAAMHVELVLDALGVSIYPGSQDLQTVHDEEARSYGRKVGGASSLLVRRTDTGTAGGAEQQEEEAFNPTGTSMPLPLKQLPEEDPLAVELAASAAASAGKARPKSLSEQLVLQHTDWADRVTGCVATNPSPALLEEAHEIIEEMIERHEGKLFITASDGTTLPFCYMYTQMGDYMKATIMLPVDPHLCQSFGLGAVVGGVGIGRTNEQARDLCALHALDLLHYLGLPCFTEQEVEREQDLRKRRHAASLLTTAVQEVCEEATATASEEKPSSAAKKHVNLTVNGGEYFLNKPYVPPPGYHIDGPERPMPDPSDTRKVIEAHIEDFQPINMSPDEILAHSVELKALVQGYCRRTEGCEVLPTLFTSTRGQAGKRAVAYNVMYLPLYLPSGERLLARGISLKKKDAERCCFMHALQLLEAHDVEPTRDRGEKKIPRSDVEAPTVSDVEETTASEGQACSSSAKEEPAPLRHPILDTHIAALRKQQGEQAKLQAAQANAWVPRSGIL